MPNEVVVVGGGPVGLWTAAELALGGVPVVVLERATERSKHSKALGVHARTLEVLTMRGLEEPFLAEGRPVASWHFGMLETAMDFRELDTPYPFLLSIPQLRTERFLEQRARELGVRIRTGHTVTGLDQDADAVRLHVDGPDGAYTQTARYVVGADGVGSAVREAAGIAYPGTEPTFDAFLGEVRVTEEPPRSIHNARGAVLAAPLPDGRYRISGVDPFAGVGTGPLTLDELRDTTVRITGTDFGMHDPIWISRTNDAARLAERYRAGRVLLAGDAAHRHLPAGGLGLNVGLQDAMNLGWRLAAVTRGDADPALLDEYHDERHRVGQDLMEVTLAQSALITGVGPDGLALRSLLNSMIGTVPAFSLALARRISALDVAYPKPGHPLTGSRVPGHFALLRRGRPVLLATTTPGPATTAAAVVAGVDIAVTPLPWTTASTVLVRPDGHTWWAADTPDDPETAAVLEALPARFQPGAARLGEATSA